MKHDKEFLIQELKKVNAAIDSKRVDVLFKYFINCEDSLPFTQTSMNLISAETGVKMSHRHAKKSVEALEVLGYKPATTKAYKSSKAGIIEAVAKSSATKLEVIEMIYDNAVSPYRLGNFHLADKMSTEYKTIGHDTVKRITHKMKMLGAPVKPVKERARVKPKKAKIKTDVVAFDDGLFRWNPAKLMPKPFAHLDNAW